MKVLELYAGLECLSNAFRERGHECFTVDWDEKFPSSLHCDVSKLTTKDIVDKFGVPDVVWVGTDCTSYSVAAISHHRRKNPDTGNLDPISDYAKFCDNTNIHVKNIISDLQKFNPNLLYFWENPMAALRKMDFMQDLPRYTVSYCQYGFTYKKATDLWTNHPNTSFKPVCKNGMHCHEAAPRGAKTGIQAITDKALKAIYPPLLCEHIVDICEDYILNTDVCIECRDCINMNMTDKCINATCKCDKYICKYNTDWRLDINDPVIIYNKTR